MESPTLSVWLDAWERGMSVPPVRRPVVLLEAWHGADAQPAAWPLGQREAALLKLRTALFGDRMESLAACPQCEAMMEFTLDAEEMRSTATAAPSERVNVSEGGASADFRLPDTRDLEAASAVSAAQRRRFLLRRCLWESEPPAQEWPEEFLATAARKMAAADPLGNVSLHLACPECGHAWEAPFDTGDFLWQELHAWAARLMSEVHILAAAYGWTEPEILALPRHRRRFYLERAQRP